MGKKKDKKERKRREREEAAARAATAPPADVATDEPHVAAAATAPPPAPAELEPAGPFPGLTPPALLRRARRDVGPADAAGMPVALAARDLVARISGASLCYGDPVTVGGRTVIPVGKVRARGGMGFGGGSDAESAGSGGGGGGGGALDAAPLGYIEVTAEGTNFTAIGGTPAAVSRSRGGAGLAAVAGAAAGIAGAALLARRRSAPTGLRRVLRRR